MWVELRSSLPKYVSLVALAGALLVGCASNEDCRGSSCVCREGTCSQSCPEGGCNYQCSGTNCELTCTGNNCQLQCDPGAESCVLRGCTSGCVLECGGAAVCTSSCSIADGCVVNP